MSIFICALSLIGLFSADFEYEDSWAKDYLLEKGFNIDSPSNVKEVAKIGIKAKDPGLVSNALRYLDSIEELDSFADEILNIIDDCQDKRLLFAIYDELSFIERIVKSKYGCIIFKETANAMKDNKNVNNYYGRVAIINIYQICGYDYSYLFACRNLVVDELSYTLLDIADPFGQICRDLPRDILLLIYLKWKDNKDFNRVGSVDLLKHIFEESTPQEIDATIIRREKIINDLKLKLEENINDFCDRYGELEIKPYSGTSSSRRPINRGSRPLL